ncbi:MAG: VWA domain-containing protein [bacterium]|nr:VWA domain-containing protein [bacterium]
MKTTTMKDLFNTVTIVTCVVFSSIGSYAQISQSSAANKQTIRSLVSVNKARYAVLSKSVVNGEIRASVVLTNLDGSTIGGYGSPYIQNNAELLHLWKEFIATNLNLTAQPDDLRVTENRSSDDATYAVAFVLDYSPSTTVPRAIRMQRAIQTALTQFAKEDFVSIVKFTGRVTVDVPASNDKEEYTSKFKVDGLNMRVNGSAVFDATIKGIEEIAATRSTRRLLILFSDGEDNSSSKSMQDAIALAKKMNVEIHTVTYGVGDDDVLSSLAKQTGGKTHELHDVYDFDRVFMGIYASMRHSYDVVVRSNNVQLAATHSPNSVISSSAPASGSIHPKEVLSLMPTHGVQVTKSSSLSDQSLTLNVDLKFEGEASNISAADLLMLDSIATVLVQRADLALEIVPGQSDASVVPEDVVIAQRRATAVRDLLIRRGVHPSRVQGFSSRPSSTEQPRGSSPKTTFVFTKM